MLRPCPHCEIIPGSDATDADLARWAAELAALPCAQCAAPQPARPEPAPLPDLPAEVAAALAAEGRTGALRAQAALDALGVGAELYGAIAAQLSAQPGTCVGWMRWWAEWREGTVAIV